MSKNDFYARVFNYPVLIFLKKFLFLAWMLSHLTISLIFDAVVHQVFKIPLKFAENSSRVYIL